MTIPANPGEWDLIRLRRVVIEHDLERARIEYKRELGNGNKVMEAIAALANTFGGVVLVGVDEDKQGADRLAGVDSAERDRLARMCWDKLVPPYSPEIVPIKLDPDDEYVLAVLVDPDYARRPVMVTQGQQDPGPHRRQQRAGGLAPAQGTLRRRASKCCPADAADIRQLRTHAGNGAPRSWSPRTSPSGWRTRAP